MAYKKKIFVGWSRDEGKIIALAIKKAFETDIFCRKNLCFVSSVDIESGTYWFDKIKGELATCSLGIIVITKDHMFRPWIYFEAGALVAREVPVIPLIIEEKSNKLKDTPLSGQHAVEFSDVEQFCKMVCDINNMLSLPPMKGERLKTLAKVHHAKLSKTLKRTLLTIRNKNRFSAQFIYPTSIDAVDEGSMFISVPMSSIPEKEYDEVHSFLQKLDPVINKLGYKTISPARNITNQKNFDGPQLAIQENFKKLKSVEYILAIYPSKVASSMLVEIGYGIALTKRIVIFYRDKNDLPYMLSEARGKVNHIMTVEYKDYDDIINTIEKNGRALFNDDSDEDGEI